MFDGVDIDIGRCSGETPEDVQAEDELAFRLTCLEMADGRVEGDRHVLPDIESMVPGPFLTVILEGVDRSRLNGFDLVRLMRARERLVSHLQAESMADAVEISHAAPGDARADPDRLEDAFAFASDEIRAALVLTRRSAANRLDLAEDVCERIPGVREMLSTGAIDLPRARVIVNGTAHLDEAEARAVVDRVSEKAGRLTTGQLAAWLRRLCVESDPRRAKQRAEHALEARSFSIEPTCDGTAHVHLWDIDIADARAIGRRVNTYMISHRKDGDIRSHGNLRADIARDLLLGSDPTNGGRGLMDMRVSMTTLAGLDDRAAEIPGLGPVIADVARRFADQCPRAEWQATITDDFDQVVAVVTTRRRPTKKISGLVNATQPSCSFPGCRMPARDCDFDHLMAWSDGGETSTRNGGPKCRHDHILKDHGWDHQRVNGLDIWTSPLGHTYTTEKPP